MKRTSKLFSVIVCAVLVLTAALMFTSCKDKDGSGTGSINSEVGSSVSSLAREVPNSALP